MYDYYGSSGVIDKIDGYLFDKPLLLIGEDGANLVNRSTPIAFIARGKYWENNHAHVLDGLDEEYLRYLELFVNATDLKPFVTGTAQPILMREEQRRLQRDIDRHEEVEQSYMDEGVLILELARNAQALFERQPAREKRRLLNFVLSNCSWEDGEVVATFRQPFVLLAETTAVAARSGAGSSGNSSKSEIWLGDQDSNLD